MRRTQRGSPDVKGSEMQYMGAVELDGVVLVVVYAVQSGLRQFDGGKRSQERVDSARSKHGVEDIPRDGNLRCRECPPQRIG